MTDNPSLQILILCRRPGVPASSQPLLHQEPNPRHRQCYQRVGADPRDPRHGECGGPRLRLEGADDLLDRCHR